MNISRTRCWHLPGRFSAALRDGQPASLYSVVDKAKIPLDVANKVVDVPEKCQLVRMIERDPLKLDHNIAITEAGARFVSA